MKRAFTTPMIQYHHINTAKENLSEFDEVMNHGLEIQLEVGELRVRTL